MEHGYVVMAGFVSENGDDYYPDTTFEEPVCICKTREDADKRIKELEQRDSDKYMDWLDENEQGLKYGHISPEDYYDEEEEEAAHYYVKEVPYYQ